MSITISMSLRGFMVAAGANSDDEDARRWAVEFYPLGWMLVKTPWWEALAHRMSTKKPTRWLAWKPTRSDPCWEAHVGRWELSLERTMPRTVTAHERDREALMAEVRAGGMAEDEERRAEAEIDRLDTVIDAEQKAARAAWLERYPEERGGVREVASEAT